MLLQYRFNYEAAGRLRNLQTGGAVVSVAEAKLLIAEDSDMSAEFARRFDFQIARFDNIADCNQPNPVPLSDSTILSPGSILVVRRIPWRPVHDLVHSMSSMPEDQKGRDGDISATTIGSQPSRQKESITSETATTDISKLNISSDIKDQNEPGQNSAIPDRYLCAHCHNLLNVPMSIRCVRGCKQSVCKSCAVFLLNQSETSEIKPSIDDAGLEVTPGVSSSGLPKSEVSAKCPSCGQEVKQFIINRALAKIIAKLDLTNYKPTAQPIQLIQPTGIPASGEPSEPLERERPPAGSFVLVLPPKLLRLLHAGDTPLLLPASSMIHRCASQISAADSMPVVFPLARGGGGTALSSCGILKLVRILPYPDVKKESSGIDTPTSQEAGGTDSGPSAHPPEWQNVYKEILPEIDFSDFICWQIEWDQKFEEIVLLPVKSQPIAGILSSRPVKVRGGAEIITDGFETVKLTPTQSTSLLERIKMENSFQVMESQKQQRRVVAPSSVSQPPQPPQPPQLPQPPPSVTIPEQPTAPESSSLSVAISSKSQGAPPVSVASSVERLQVSDQNVSQAETTVSSLGTPNADASAPEPPSVVEEGLSRPSEVVGNIQMSPEDEITEPSEITAAVGGALTEGFSEDFESAAQQLPLLGKTGVNDINGHLADGSSSHMSSVPVLGDGWVEEGGGYLYDANMGMWIPITGDYVKYLKDSSKNAALANFEMMEGMSESALGGRQKKNGRDIMSRSRFSDLSQSAEYEQHALGSLNHKKTQVFGISSYLKSLIPPSSLFHRIQDIRNLVSHWSLRNPLLPFVSEYPKLSQSQFQQIKQLQLLAGNRLAAKPDCESWFKEYMNPALTAMYTESVIIPSSPMDDERPRESGTRYKRKADGTQILVAGGRGRDPVHRGGSSNISASNYPNVPTVPPHYQVMDTVCDPRGQESATHQFPAGGYRGGPPVGPGGRPPHLRISSTAVEPTIRSQNMTEVASHGGGPRPHWVDQQAQRGRYMMPFGMGGGPGRSVDDPSRGAGPQLHYSQSQIPFDYLGDQNNRMHGSSHGRIPLPMGVPFEGPVGYYGSMPLAGYPGSQGGPPGHYGMSAHIPPGYRDPHSLSRMNAHGDRFSQMPHIIPHESDFGGPFFRDSGKPSEYGYAPVPRGHCVGQRQPRSRFDMSHPYGQPELRLPHDHAEAYGHEEFSPSRRRPQSLLPMVHPDEAQLRLAALRQPRFAPGDHLPHGKSTRTDWSAGGFGADDSGGIGRFPYEPQDMSPDRVAYSMTGDRNEHSADRGDVEVRRGKRPTEERLDEDGLGDNKSILRESRRTRHEDRTRDQSNDRRQETYSSTFPTSRDSGFREKEIPKRDSNTPESEIVRPIDSYSSSKRQKLSSAPSTESRAPKRSEFVDSRHTDNERNVRDRDSPSPSASADSKTSTFVKKPRPNDNEIKRVRGWVHSTKADYDGADSRNVPLRENRKVQGKADSTLNNDFRRVDNSSRTCISSIGDSSAGAHHGEVHNESKRNDGDEKMSGPFSRRKSSSLDKSERVVNRRDRTGRSRTKRDNFESINNNNNHDATERSSDDLRTGKISRTIERVLRKDRSNRRDRLNEKEKSNMSDRRERFSNKSSAANKTSTTNPQTRFPTDPNSDIVTSSKSHLFAGDRDNNKNNDNNNNKNSNNNNFRTSGRTVTSRRIPLDKSVSVGAVRLFKASRDDLTSSKIDSASTSRRRYPSTDNLKSDIKINSSNNSGRRVSVDDIHKDKNSTRISNRKHVSEPYSQNVRIRDTNYSASKKPPVQRDSKSSPVSLLPFAIAALTSNIRNSSTPSGSSEPDMTPGGSPQKKRRARNSLFHPLSKS